MSFRRHLMSEADEDEELLDDELGDKVITMFSENPWCELLYLIVNEASLLILVVPMVIVSVTLYILHVHVLVYYKNTCMYDLPATCIIMYMYICICVDTITV